MIPTFLLPSAVLLWGIGLCASVVHLCVRVRICVCLCQWMSEVSQDCSSMIGAGSPSEACLGLRDIDFDAVSALRGGVLSYWRRPLCCHQPFPGFLPLLVHSRVHTPVLPRWQLGLSWLLWHRWWKLLVVILRESRQEREGIRYSVVRAENTASSGGDTELTEGKFKLNPSRLECTTTTKHF